jgi:NADP-dependent 3-hydroxy acid dehydrogenase YdfG
MTLSSELSGRVAVVTGASAGIGRAIAADLVARGARVVVNARRAEKLDAFVRELSAGRREPVAVAVAGDAADDATIAAMLDAAKRAFGREADAVIVNAGRGLKGSATDSDTSQWEELIRTNLLGAARLIRAAAARLLAQVPAGEPWTSHPRDLVVIGSIVGRHVSPFSSMYGSTKFAVHGLTEGVRRELGPKGVRVTLVEPGFVTSEFQGVAGYADEWYKGVVERLGPVLLPEDVARTISFVLAQPAHVHVSDFIVRPTRQDYP